MLMSIKSAELKELAKMPEWVIDVDHGSVAWCNPAASVLFVESSQKNKRLKPAISVTLQRKLTRFLLSFKKGPTRPVYWTFQSVQGQYYDCIGSLVSLGPDSYGVRVKARKRASFFREPTPIVKNKQVSNDKLAKRPAAVKPAHLIPGSQDGDCVASVEEKKTVLAPIKLPLTEFSQLSFAIFDRQFKLTDASALFNSTFVEVTELKDIFVLHSDLNKVLKFIAANVKQTKSLSQQWELRLATCQGVRWHQLEIHFDPNLSQSYVSLIDIHQIREQKNALFKLKNYDSLTGLANRHLLYQELDITLKKAQKNQTEFGVLYLDLDGFKVVNDSFGHRVGDELIVQVAERLSSILKKGTRLYRLGGDEFALLQEEVDGIEGLEALARELMQVACAAYPISKMEMLITASIGIAHYPTHGRDVDTLLKRADVAMYRAKSIGHNTYKVYDNNMSQSLNAYLTLGGGLRRAIENQEFELYYQPKVRLSDQLTVGAEALIRWQHPEFGMISPDRFIPIAEETGLILPLGEWVIRSACKQLQKWRQQGHDDITLSINLSSRQFMQADLVNMVQQVLHETGVDPKNLELELTESMLMADADQTIEKLHGFRQLGLTLSIDDFGTGYSSLAYLKKFPIQTLKIDRSFVRDLGSNLDDNAIVKATIAMAASLNLKVIAEGVENYSQLNVLKGYDCEEVQGYFFAKPMSSQDFSRYMRKDEGRMSSAFSALH